MKLKHSEITIGVLLHYTGTKTSDLHDVYMDDVVRVIEIDNSDPTDICYKAINVTVAKEHGISEDDAYPFYIDLKEFELYKEPTEEEQVVINLALEHCKKLKLTGTKRINRKLGFIAGYNSALNKI